MNFFATLFDINYLTRGLSLAESLNNVLKDNYHLFVLALDIETITYFDKRPDKNITIISLDELEVYYPELAEAKLNRTKTEYYFTLSPVLPLYVLQNFEKCNRITSLDADIYFFSSPEIIFESYHADAVLITPHDFSDDLKHLENYGKYNVSFQSFPNNANGLAVLQNWKANCLKWCKDEIDPETNNYADQKYLDYWADEFENIQPINLKTCGRAPWNIADTNLTRYNGKLLVDGKPLVYYHFHQLRITKNHIAHRLHHYQYTNISNPVKQLYGSYISAIARQQRLSLSYNDTNISRNASLAGKNLFTTIWQTQMGGIRLLNKIFYYNITPLKSIYNKLLQLTNAPSR